MALLDSIASKTHSPTARLRLDGRALSPIGITVDLGWDSVSSRAVLDLPAIPDWARFRGVVDVDLGWDGFFAPVFHGFVEDDGRDHAPIVNQMQAAGYLRLAQYQAIWATPLSGTDGDVIETLLGTAAGVPSYSIDDAGLTLGVVKSLLLNKGSAPWDLINKIDQVTGHKTLDGPTIPMRRYVSGIPAGTAAFAYVQDENIYSAKRVGTMREVHNRVEVYGLPQPSGTPGYFYYGFSPLVPVPPGYINFEFRSDLIETTAIANNVANRLLGEMNRATEDIEIEIPGNPLITPTMTASLLYPDLGITTATNYFVKHITHRYGADGYRTRCILTGGLGNIGQGGVIPSPGTGGTIGDQPDGAGGVPGPGTGPGSPPVIGPGLGQPIAQFTVNVSRETKDVGGTPTDIYTIFADASSSVDTDTPPGGLTYAWTNTANGDVGTGQFYATSLTLAQFTSGATITLVVTDGNGDTDTISQAVSLAASLVTVRDLYAAVGTKATATPDGGKTWNDWTPAAGTVISTPEIAGNISYFGLTNGELYYTTDRLATAPTLAHTFASQVECIWINEVNANRVTVGLADGGIWQTNDAGSVASATWTLLYDFAAPVLWLIESFANQGEIRVAVGTTIQITFDNGGTWSTLITFSSGTARKSALSFFTNYGSGTVAAAATNAVQTEAGASITFPVVSPEVIDVRALTHHIREDVLYAADLNGTTLRSWQKAIGASVFTAKATMASAGQPNHMIRDGANQLTHYIAADEGLFKTFDGFTTIVKLLDLSAAGLLGYQIGYGAITALSVGGGGSGPPGPPGGGGGGGGGGGTPLEVVSTAGQGKVLDLGTPGTTAPTGWTELAFDDSAWAAAILSSQDYNGTYPDMPMGAAQWITANDGAPAPDFMSFLHRRTFPIPAGVITTATIEWSADNWLLGLWVNNVALGITFNSDGQYGKSTLTISANLLLPGQTNILAFWCKNTENPAAPTINPTAMAFRLVVS